MKNVNNLKDIISVPYLPVLGLVHPDEINNSIIADIEKTSSQKTVLSYDKQLRWSAKPLEYISKILRTKDGLSIETTQKNRRCLYVYGKNHDATADGCNILVTVSAEEKASQADEACTIAYLDDYGRHQYSNDKLIFAHDFPIETLQTMQSLGDESSASGFRHLIESGRISDQSSPILVVLQNNQIIGAIGPLNILKDSRGVKRLLPVYFGVAADAKRSGIGTKLWNQSRQWAIDGGAGYSVLQAEYNSPASAFYETNGLTKLGYIYKRNLR